MPYATQKQIRLIRIAENRHGFLTEDDIKELARDPEFSHLPCLVRCGAGRFITQLRDVQHFTEIITRENSDYIRDVAFTVETNRKIKSGVI
jgi:hypothetical protein